MVAGLLPEGRLFFAKDRKDSTHFRREIASDLNLREAVDALQEFHSKAAIGSPEVDITRHAKHKY
jgi:hypothetical protein